MKSKTNGLKCGCTQTELAESLGISRVTVHRAFIDGSSVKPKVRQRVLEAADRLGYRRNELARAMVTGKSRVLAYINGDPSAEVRSRILIGAQEEADERNYLIKLLHTPFNPTMDDVHTAVRRCVEHRIAGAIAILPVESLPTLHETSLRYGIPMSLLDDIDLHGWGIRISTDDAKGIQLAVEYLAELGHRDIAMISGPSHSTLATGRMNGFRAAMEKLKLPLREETVVFSEWAELEPNMRDAHRVLDAVPRPTAIVCGSDYVAMAVLRAAYDRKLRVPDDLSVTGFANLSFTAVACPALTTVSQPFEELGRVAVRRLLEVIESDNDENLGAEANAELLSTKLVVRDSTSPPAVSEGSPF